MPQVTTEQIHKFTITLLGVEVSHLVAALETAIEYSDPECYESLEESQEYLYFIRDLLNKL
jgi:hypothetical protein